MKGALMPDELLDIIDENDHIIGQDTKDVVHEQGLRHRVAAVLLQREDGKYLIPTASDIKVDAGRLYHSAAGHVLSGESYLASAKRELAEETGVTVQQLDYLGTFWFEENYPGRKEKERFEVYRAYYRTNYDPVVLNEEQIDEKWLNEEEIKTIYLEEPQQISLPLKETCNHIFGFENYPIDELTQDRKKSPRPGKETGKTTVYFGCSMLGGYGFLSQEELAKFPKLIVGLGYLLATDHQTQPDVLEREAKMDHTFIHDRDYEWLMNSDLGIFEISNPSLGVGGEISDMIHLNKPVLLLYKEGLEERVSAYVRGKQGSKFVKSPVECQSYRDRLDVKIKIQSFVESHFP